MPAGAALTRPTDRTRWRSAYPPCGPYPLALPFTRPVGRSPAGAALTRPADRTRWRCAYPPYGL
ncbi:hypothetical protein CWM52_13955 [Raoultella sp. T31]|nr:hypothetical protein CWM52_13955 [Raoultella sp. T31]